MMLGSTVRQQAIEIDQCLACNHDDKQLAELLL